MSNQKQHFTEEFKKQMVAAQIDGETVIEKLLERYEVTRQQCEEEVTAFLNGTNKEGLLEVQ